jgi:hypothetical protein
MAGLCERSYSTSDRKFAASQSLNATVGGRGEGEIVAAGVRQLFEAFRKMVEAGGLIALAEPLAFL